MPYYSYDKPNLTYTLTFNGHKINMFDSIRVSFVPPYNSISVSFLSTNCSLSYYEVRLTTADQDYDIGVGALLHNSSIGGIARNTPYTFTIPITRSVFNSGDIQYRLGFYAKSAVDGSWDCTYLLLGLPDDIQFISSEGDLLSALTIRPQP